MLRIYFPRFGNESSYDNRKPREPPFDKARFIRCTNNFLSSFFSTIVTYLFLFNSNYFVARSFVFKSRSNSFLRNNFNIVRLFFRSSLGNRSYRNDLCWENTLYLTWNVEKVVAKIQNFNLEDEYRESSTKIRSKCKKNWQAASIRLINLVIKSWIWKRKKEEIICTRNSSDLAKFD